MDFTIYLTPKLKKHKLSLKMSIISFSKPSDVEILEKVSDEEQSVSFVGKGSIRQDVNETLYIRTVKITKQKKEIFKNVVFVKKGISWLFKSIENASA